VFWNGHYFKFYCKTNIWDSRVIFSGFLSSRVVETQYIINIKILFFNVYNSEEILNLLRFGTVYQVMEYSTIFITTTDRKSTRLNSSHSQYLVCRLLLEKKNTISLFLIFHFPSECYHPHLLILPIPNACAPPNTSHITPP